MCSFYINVLYSYIILTILDSLISYKYRFVFPLLFFFFSCVCICTSIFLLTCILILFNADVNWLPSSASPYGYSRQLVLQFYVSQFCNFFCLKQVWMWVQIKIVCFFFYSLIAPRFARVPLTPPGLRFVAPSRFTLVRFIVFILLQL